MITCRRMTSDSRAEAARILGEFLHDDHSYLAAADVYGDGGRDALERALDLFLQKPQYGFVWLAFEGAKAVGACVACYAISTSRGTLVAKLDDVSVTAGARGKGIGSRMLSALAEELGSQGITRIDTAIHQDNPEARRFYEKLGFRPLREERFSWLL